MITATIRKRGGRTSQITIYDDDVVIVTYEAMNISVTPIDGFYELVFTITKRIGGVIHIINKSVFVTSYSYL